MERPSLIERKLSQKRLEEKKLPFASQPHKFTKQHFESPSQCLQCKEYIWGLVSDGYSCLDCGFVVHLQCLAKVPPNCTGKKLPSNDSKKVIVKVKDESKSRSPESQRYSQRNSTTPRFEIPSSESVTSDDETLIEEDEEDESFLEPDEKDQVGKLLQLIRAKSNVFYSVNNDNRETMIKQVKTGHSKTISLDIRDLPDLVKDAPTEIPDPRARAQSTSITYNTDSLSKRMAARMVRERAVSNAFERKPAETDLDHLLRLAKKTDQDQNLFEQMQKQNLKLMEKSPFSDDIHFDDDDDTSGTSTPVGSPSKQIYPKNEPQEINVTHVQLHPVANQDSVSRPRSHSTLQVQYSHQKNSRIKKMYQLYSESPSAVPRDALGRTTSAGSLHTRSRSGSSSGRSTRSSTVSKASASSGVYPILTKADSAQNLQERIEHGNRRKSNSFSRIELPSKTARLVEELNKGPDPAEQHFKQLPPSDTDSCIAVELKLDKDEYMPGTSVSGTFYLDLIKPLRYTKGVRILFQGFEKAFRGSWGSEGAHRRDYQSEMFFKHLITLWEPNDKDQVLLAGQHSWSFTFELPVNLPPTIYFEDWASIFYQCRGFVDPGSGLDKINKKQAIVAEKVVFDVYSVNVKLWRTIVVPFTKPTTASKVSPKGNVTISTELPRKDYYIGETIHLRVKAQNHLNKQVSATLYKIDLMQHIRVHTKSWHCEFEPSVLASHTFEFKGFKIHEMQIMEKEFDILIPEDVDDHTLVYPTTTGLLFTITHTLRLAINIKGFKPLSIPIRLWDSCWDDNSDIVEELEEGVTRQETVRRPSVTLAPSNWKFQTIKVWSKSLKELPVAIDLPRLSSTTVIIDVNRRVDKLNEVQGIEDYNAIGIKAKGPNDENLQDISFRKGDILTLADSAEIIISDVTYSHVRLGNAHALVPSRSVAPNLFKEEQILNILTILSSRLEGESRAAQIRETYWKYITRDSIDVSRELNKFLVEVIKEGTPTLQILKACNQSIIAPAVIELTLNVCPKISFKDGGGWRIQIKFNERGMIEITHWKKQKHVPRTGEPELFQFEWQLTLVLDSKAETVIDAAFVLSNIEFTEYAGEEQKDEITLILEQYFKYGPSLKEGEKPTTIFPYTPRKGTLWALPKKEIMMHDSVSNLIVSTTDKPAEKPVSLFFATSSSQQLRDLDIIHDNRDTKLQNLSKYYDEDEELYEALSAERKAKITLEEKIRRKWKKSSEELVIASILPGIYKKVEISTSDGLVRLSPFYSPVDAGNSKTKTILSFLESLAILLLDVKDTLPNLIKYFRIEQEQSANYLGKFFKEQMKEDCKTMKALKAINLSIMSSAFSVLKDNINKRFPFTDIAAAWKISISIGSGDGSSSDKITIVHSKAAKSLDSSSDGSFEFLWQLTLTFASDLRDLQAVSLKIPTVQVSPRFPKTKLKDLTNLIRQFNELDHCMHIHKEPVGNYQQNYAVRKKVRSKLRKIPKADLSNPTLRKDCNLYVKIIEAKNLAQRKKKSVFGMLGNHAETVLCNPFAIVKVDQSSHRTRTLLNTVKPFWSEDFNFEIFNPMTQSLTVTICDAQLLGEDTSLGQITVQLKDLLDQETKEEWYQLLSEEGISGHLRLKLKYSEEMILPGPLYDEMVDLLLDKKLTIVKLLGRVTENSEEREHILLSLVKIFEEKNLAVFLLNSFCDDEIAKTGNPDIIFRGNSVASRALDSYMKFMGHAYLVSTLHPVITKIYAFKKALEIDPSKSTHNIHKNMKKLETLCEQILSSVFESAANCPTSIRECFRHLQEKVEEMYKPEQAEITRYTSVTGYLFLRFFCPAIMAPKTYNIMEAHPGVHTTRTLMLVAKVVQRIANLSVFANQEEFMNPLNKLIEENTENMRKFINEISKVPYNAPPKVRPHIQLEKELASVHRFLKKNKEIMLKNQTDEESTAVKRMLTVLDNLEYISQHEKITEYPEAKSKPTSPLTIRKL